MRVILQFEKTGPAKYISHLDVLRAMQRALRRARVPVAYSQGFNPHMLLSFATALSLGQQSRAELLDMKLTRMVDLPQMLKDLNAAFPTGFYAPRARAADDGEPKLTKRMKWASYHITTEQPCGAQAAAFLQKERCVVEKRGKKGVREVDIRPMVRSLAWDESDGALTAMLTCCDSIALSPELLLAAMEIQGPAQVTRTGLYGQRDDELIDLFDGGSVL